MFSELWRQLGQTRVRQFPRAEWVHCVQKAVKECSEVLLAPRSKRPEEYADIIICVINAAAADGFDANEIYTALMYKDMVNNVRKFQLGPDGLYQHMPEE